MSEAEVIDITRAAIMLMIQLSAPIMLIGLGVGVIIALFQALTQIQEMSLAFVPKIVAIFLSIAILFPAMASSLINFTQMLADRIIGIS